MKSYKPVVAPEKAPRDKTEARRVKFIAAVNEQLKLLDDPAAKRPPGRKGKVLPIRSWVMTGTDGNAVLVAKFGLSPLQLQPGKAGLMLGKLDPHAIKDVMGKLIQAAEAGELDGVLATAAASRKPPVRKKKAA